MNDDVPYPGVRVEGVSRGVGARTGVPTSVTAFIGRAQRGPVNEPTAVSSFAGFEREFGGLWKHSCLGFAVRDFFQNGGTQAVIVRLYSAIHGTDHSPNVAPDATKTDDTSVVGAAVQDRAETCKYSGTSTQEKKAASEPTPGSATAAPGTDINGTTAIGAGNLVAAAVNKAEKLNERMTDPMVPAGIGPAAPLGKARIRWDNLQLEATSEGSWGNELKVRVDHSTPNPGLTTQFNLTVRDVGSGTTETHRNLSTSRTDARFVGVVLENESVLVRLRSDPTTRPRTHDTAPAGISDPFDDRANTATVTAHSTVTERGSDGNELGRNDFIGPSKEKDKEGLFALEKADIFNLLCIPPYASSDGEAVDVDGQVWASAAGYCEVRRAMLIVDASSAWTDKSKAKKGLDRLGTKSMNAAAFFPHLVQSNPMRNNQKERFVPCGAVAGVIARTDATCGVWKAPAGVEATLVGVPGLSVSLTDADIGELNPIGLNCLRSMEASAPVVWGDRTLQDNDSLPPEWRYLHVRRTALFIEETLHRGLQWVVFEPNDEHLWREIRSSVEAFMLDLFRRGAFQGHSPQDGYFVKCDRETTTRDDVGRGAVNIWVGFAPLGSADFVVIRLQKLAGQPRT